MATVITSREWRIIAILSAAIIILSLLPYLAAWRQAPPGTVFTGLLTGAVDNFTYLSKMRQGFDGSWRWHLAHTAEPHEGIKHYLFYLFLGHLARWSGLPIIVVFHAARLLFGFALLLSVYRFIAELIPQPRYRLLAFYLATLASGAGALAWLAGLPGLSDMMIPEINVFYSILTNPHFTISYTMALWGLLFCFRPPRSAAVTVRDVYGRSLALVIAGGIILISAPYLFPPLAGTIALVTFSRLLRGGISRAAFLPVMVFLIVTSIMFLGQLLLFRTHPTVSRWIAQSVMASPPLGDYLLGGGLLVPLALFGITRLRSGPSPLGWATVWWSLLIVTFAYAPVSIQRRFISGLHLPLGIIAGLGARQLIITLRKPSTRAVMATAIVALTIPTTATLYYLCWLAPEQDNAHVYLSNDEHNAFHWLDTHLQGDEITLVPNRLGIQAPYYIGGRVVCGSLFETLEPLHKRFLVNSFYDGTLTHSATARFLAQNHVTYILIPLHTPGRALLGALPGRKLAYANATVAVYRVD